MIGEKVAETGIDKLVVIGDGAEAIGRGALQKGMKEDDVRFCRDTDETYAYLADNIDGNTVVLIKTSMLSSYDDLMNRIVIDK